MTATAKKTEKNIPAKARDAIALLRADHREVNELFNEYETIRSAAQKKQLVSKICAALTVHAQIEEEIFYPRVKLALKDKELIPEAYIEHSTLKLLIEQIEGVEPDGEMFNAKVKVLSEYVKHHVKEEQNEIFPKVKAASKLDLAELRAQLLVRKQELLAERA